MFTLDQIEAAHSKVKSGSDFPAYIRDLIKLGVRKYETFVADNHTDYYGSSGKQVSSQVEILHLSPSKKQRKEQFIANLKLHQAGKTDYQTFRKDCAENGISIWVVEMEKMTCTYFDVDGNQVLVETIPF